MYEDELTKQRQQRNQEHEQECLEHEQERKECEQEHKTWEQCFAALEARVMEHTNPNTHSRFLKKASCPAT